MPLALEVGFVNDNEKQQCDTLEGRIHTCKPCKLNMPRGDEEHESHYSSEALAQKSVTIDIGQ